MENRFKNKLLEFLESRSLPNAKQNEPYNVTLEQEDCYAVTPPIECFLNLPQRTKRRHFFRCVAVGDVVVGRITAVQELGLTVTLLCMENHKARDLEDLGITAVCGARDVPRYYTHESPLEAFSLRDTVRAAVTDVLQEQERLLVTMLEAGLPPHAQHLKLGFVNDEDLPSHYRLMRSETLSSYADALKSLPGFSNPNNVAFMTEMLGLDDVNPHSLIPAIDRPAIAEAEYADKLRDAQSLRWSMESVQKGVEFFKRGEHVEAMQMLNRGLTICAENVEGLVARGALYANKESYVKAAEDFEKALEVNPKHKNAQKYLGETLLAHAKSAMKKEDRDSARALLERATRLRAAEDEARDLLLRMRERERRELEELRLAASVEKRAPSARPIVVSDDEDEKVRSGETRRTGFEDSSTTLRNMIERERKRKRRRSQSSSSSSSSSTSKSRSRSRTKSQESVVTVKVVKKQNGDRSRGATPPRQYRMSPGRRRSSSPDGRSRSRRRRSGSHTGSRRSRSRRRRSRDASPADRRWKSRDSRSRSRDRRESRVSRDGRRARGDRSRSRSREQTALRQRSENDTANTHAAGACAVLGAQDVDERPQRPLSAGEGNQYIAVKDERGNITVRLKTDGEDTVTSRERGEDTVTSRERGEDTVTSRERGRDTVTSRERGRDTVTSRERGEDTVTSRERGEDTVTSRERGRDGARDGAPYWQGDGGADRRRSGDVRGRSRSRSSSAESRKKKRKKEKRHRRRTEGVPAAEKVEGPRRVSLDSGEAARRRAERQREEEEEARREAARRQEAEARRQEEARQREEKKQQLDEMEGFLNMLKSNKKPAAENSEFKKNTNPKKIW